MWQYNDVLYHHGIKGQKWGHRRYQYENGSLTPEGRVHYGVGKARGDDSSSTRSGNTPAKKSFKEAVSNAWDKHKERVAEKRAAKEAAAEERRKEQERQTYESYKDRIKQIDRRQDEIDEERLEVNEKLGDASREASKWRDKADQRANKLHNRFFTTDEEWDGKWKKLDKKARKYEDLVDKYEEQLERLRRQTADNIEATEKAKDFISRYESENPVDIRSSGFTDLFGGKKKESSSPYMDSINDLMSSYNDDISTIKSDADRLKALSDRLKSVSRTSYSDDDYPGIRSNGLIDKIISDTDIVSLDSLDSIEKYFNLDPENKRDSDKYFLASVAEDKRNKSTLKHHGILGQKWGRRRYQYENGSLTPEGRIHYGVGKARDDGDVSTVDIRSSGLIFDRPNKRKAKAKKPSKEMIALQQENQRLAMELEEHNRRRQGIRPYMSDSRYGLSKSDVASLSDDELNQMVKRLGQETQLKKLLDSRLQTLLANDARFRKRERNKAVAAFLGKHVAAPLVDYGMKRFMDSRNGGLKSNGSKPDLIDAILDAGSTAMSGNPAAVASKLSSKPKTQNQTYERAKKILETTSTMEFDEIKPDPNWDFGTSSWKNSSSYKKASSFLDSYSDTDYKEIVPDWGEITPEW